MGPSRTDNRNLTDVFVTAQEVYFHVMEVLFFGWIPDRGLFDALKGLAAISAFVGTDGLFGMGNGNLIRSTKRANNRDKVNHYKGF
jgi:hypothetical protein